MFTEILSVYRDSSVWYTSLHGCFTQPASIWNSHNWRTVSLACLQPRNNVVKATLPNSNHMTKPHNSENGRSNLAQASTIFFQLRSVSGMKSPSCHRQFIMWQEQVVKIIELAQKCATFVFEKFISVYGCYFSSRISFLDYRKPKCERKRKNAILCFDINFQHIWSH